MRLHISTLCELFVTDRTGVELAPAVYMHMAHQTRLTEVSLPTQRAHMRSSFVVIQG